MIKYSITITEVDGQIEISAQEETRDGLPSYPEVFSMLLLNKIIGEAIDKTISQITNNESLDSILGIITDANGVFLDGDDDSSSSDDDDEDDDDKPGYQDEILQNDPDYEYGSRKLDGDCCPI